MLRIATVLLLVAVPAVNAQAVHRCGNPPVYTDKPCDGATPVDLRANILDAGPRQMPAPPAPQPAIILPGGGDPPKPESSGSLWDRRDAKDQEQRARTGPYRP